MGIVSSTYTIDAYNQADGTKYVTEQHTDSTGKVYSFGPYRVSSESIVSTYLSIRVNRLNTLLAISEFEKCIATNIDINLQHQSGSEFANRYWERLKEAFLSKNMGYYSYLIWWLYNRVASSNLTSNDIRISYNNFFNKSLNLTQWNNLVTTRFIPARNRYQAMLDEVII